MTPEDIRIIAAPLRQLQREEDPEIIRVIGDILMGDIGCPLP
jgi:hypothetical protein